MALRAWHRAREQCDRSANTECSTNSPIGVFYIWAVSCLKYDSRDPLTGLPFNLSDFGSPLKPTLLAHKIHKAPLDLGQLKKVPTQLSDFDDSRRNARVEAWGVNKFLRSYRLPAVEAFMDGLREYPVL